MNNAGLASLFTSTGTGNPTLDAALGIQPVTDEELAAYQAQMAAFAQSDNARPTPEPQFQPQSQPLPQGEVAGISPNASTAYQFFLNKGLAPHQAAAVVGNLMQESGSALPTNITNSIGAHGIAQWLGGRKAALLNRPDPNSLNTQLNFIWDELNTTEKKAFNKLLQTQTPEEASYAVRKFYERPGEHEANDPRRVKNTYSILQGAGSPASSAPTAPAQPQEAMELPPNMQRVWLSDGQELYAPKELDVPQIAEHLKAQGVEAVPLRDFTTPAGQIINVPYDMPDKVALAHLQQSAPELLKPIEQPKAPTAERAPEEGLTAAAASGFKGALGSIASGVGGEAQELAKQPWMPELVGEAGQQVGQWLQESGAELKAKADKYHRPKDMSKFEEYVSYPIAETAGQIGAYAIPYTLPAVGMLAGTASLYGSSMDQLKERAQKENKEWNPEDARPYALLDTAVNALGMRTLGPLKNMLGKEAVLGSRAAIKEIAEKEGLDAAKQYVGSRLGNVAKQLGITEAAFVSGEVAEQAIERAYADLPLFDEEALSEYGAVAKQMAPLGFVSGVAKGVGARHVKAEAVAHLEEQQATQAALAQQEAEAQQREELANTQVREAAEKKAAKMEEIPPELRDMPYKEAKVFQKMLAEREAEVPSEEIAEVPAEPPAPVEPVSGVTPPAAEMGAEEIPYYDTLGLKNLKRNNAYKALQQFDINNPAHAAPINTILDEIEKKGMPRDQAAINAIRAKTEEVKLNAVNQPQAGEIRSDVSQQPREGEEIGYVPESRQGMVEEGRAERPAVQGYEEQKISETEAPEVKGPITKEARIISPDRGIKPIDVPSYADTSNARDLAQRVKSLGTDPELKALTDTIMLSPHLGNIAVKWAKAEDVLPEGIRERFNTGTKAIVDWPAKDVQPTIYFDTTSPYLQEDTTVHELVHGVTEAALRRNAPLANELVGLSKTVGTALREWAGFAHGSKDMEIADFWDRAVKGDPGELLAYGLTSPTFRQTLEQFGADGKPFKAYRTEAELNALRKGKIKPEKSFTAQPPKKLTLWDKFVDAASRLFGLPTKRRDAFKQQLNDYLNKKAEHEQRVQYYGTLTPFHEKLDTAFKELLRDTSKKGVAVTEAETKSAEVTPTEKTPKKASGLVGKMQDKTLGEKMGELGRDLFTEGRRTSFATEGIDARAGLRKGVQPLGSMVGKKLRADLLYSAFEQRGNVIQESYHKGYAALGSDGSVQAIDNAQLAPINIFQRVGKKDIEDFGHVLVAMRGKSIRADDRRIKAQADEFLNKADMLEDAAARTKDVKKAKSYNKSASNLRDLAEKKLKSINYEKGRTHVTEEDIAEAEAIIAKKPHLQREAENVYELLRKQVDLWEKAELIDAETADRFRNYENYFPLYKTEEYDKMMIDPSKYVENIVSHMGRGLNNLPNIKAQKHHAHQIFVEKNLLRHIAFMTSAAAQHSTQKNTIMQLELTGGAERMPKGYKPTKDEQTVLIKEKGKPVYYKVPDPDVYYAMQAAQPLMSPLLRRLKGMTNFARGVMVVNPLFWFRQLIREPLQASMVGKVGMVTPFDTIAAIGRITAGKSEGYKKLRSKGVIGPVDVIKDPIEFAKVAFGDKNFVVRRWEDVKHIHEIVDAGTRVAVYDKAKADGLSKGMDEETASDYATMRARELINFSKQGRSQAIRSLRATTPFFGAALNSMDVMARAAFPKTLGKLSKAEVMEAQRTFYSSAATLALYTTAYTMLMSDDEDYLNSSSKRGFWLVPREDEEAPFYKIAVNFESGWFTKELPELLTLYNMGLISKKEAVSEGAKGFKELVAPPMPTIFAIEPMVEVAIDHDFYTGNAIDSGKDAHELARFRDRKASELSKAIIGKMEDMGVNVASLSPNQLEHLFRSYFGQLWAVTRAASDSYLYEGPPKTEKKLSELPLVSGVVAGAERDKAVNQFMDVYNDAAEVERSYNAARKADDVDKFQTIVKSEEYKKSIKAQRALEDNYKRMGEVKGQMETLDNMDIAADVKTKRMRALEEKYRLLARDGVRKAKLLGIEM